MRIPVRDDSTKVSVHVINYGGLFPLVTIGAGESGSRACSSEWQI